MQKCVQNNPIHIALNDKIKLLLIIFKNLGFPYINKKSEFTRTHDTIMLTTKLISIILVFVAHIAGLLIPEY